jgi:hypothetical protein
MSTVAVPSHHRMPVFTPAWSVIAGTAWERK